nr:MAG TPA: hypothetical protein [Caudoviricetes sp.]
MVKSMVNKIKKALNPLITKDTALVKLFNCYHYRPL